MKLVVSGEDGGEDREDGGEDGGEDRGEDGALLQRCLKRSIYYSAAVNHGTASGGGGADQRQREKKKKKKKTRCIRSRGRSSRSNDLEEFTCLNSFLHERRFSSSK